MKSLIRYLERRISLKQQDGFCEELHYYDTETIRAKEKCFFFCVRVSIIILPHVSLLHNMWKKGRFTPCQILKKQHLEENFFHTAECFIEDLHYFIIKTIRERRKIYARIAIMELLLCCSQKLCRERYSHGMRASMGYCITLLRRLTERDKEDIGLKFHSTATSLQKSYNIEAY